MKAATTVARGKYMAALRIVVLQDVVVDEHEGLNGLLRNAHVQVEM